LIIISSDFYTQDDYSGMYNLNSINETQIKNR
jgi:hypothetical protein